MAAVLAPLLVIGGFAAYMIATFQLAWFQRIPWLFLAIMVLGVALGVRAVWRRPRVWTGLSAAVSVAAFAWACWFLFVGTMHGPREDRPRVGETFPDFALPTSTGETFRLSEARDRRHLIVLYRGDW
ncbi:MAG: hypothetical protein AB1689_19220 [Thermodesulfobacteriota bacterium]